MQELPMELKEDYLRRADLLMRPQDTAGHSSDGPAQVGRHPGGPAQVGHHPGGPAQVGGIGGIWDWDCVGHAPGQPSVGQAQVGSWTRLGRGGRAMKGTGRVKKFPRRRALVGHAVGSGHCPDGQPQCDQPLGQDAVGHPTGQVESLFF